MRALCLLFCSLALCPLALAQDDEITQGLTATITVGAYTPICTVSSSSNLSFGGNARQSSSGSIAMRAHDEDITRTNLPQQGSSTPAFGAASMSALHASTSSSAVTVTAGFPSSLASGSNSVTYSGNWAWSSTSGGTYTDISGTSVSRPGAGQGNSSTVHLRFGGTASGISRTATPVATYTGTITVTAVCS